MVQVHGLVMFDEKEEEALQFSHTVMRYTIFSYVLAVKRISTVNIKSDQLGQAELIGELSEPPK